MEWVGRRVPSGERPLTYDDFLRRLPKVELHCHLLGSVRAATLADLAAKHGVTLPADPIEVYKHINSRPPPDERYRHTRIPMPVASPGSDADPAYSLLQVSEWFAAVVLKEADFARVAYESIQDAADNNIRYREMFFEPTLYGAHGTGYRTLVDGLIDGLRAAERDFGIPCRLIAGINRADSPTAARELVEQMLAEPREEVIGIGLENFELAGPPERFVEGYRLAGQGGLRRTAHAAEHDPSARNVVTCLDLLGCDRIDHGYFVLEDDAVVARCRDQGVVFTCIFTTSRRAWRPWRRLSIKAMVEAGLRVSLASDDPAMFPTTLNNEYLIAGIDLAMPAETIRQICMNGIEGSWMDETEKRRLRDDFTREIGELEGELMAAGQE